MYYSSKLRAGEYLPRISVPTIEGGKLRLGKTLTAMTWQLIVFYRGQHCPICKAFLLGLNDKLKSFADIDIEVVAVSADSQEQTQQYCTENVFEFPVAYDLSELQMKMLGLYISKPRSEKETDHNFPEPAMLVTDVEGRIIVIDIANNPFVRPDLETLINGLAWIRHPDNSYPIRGTLNY